MSFLCDILELITPTVRISRPALRLVFAVNAVPEVNKRISRIWVGVGAAARFA